MRIVLDTNVLVSALLNPSGYPAKVLNLIALGKLELILDNRIFLEYKEVLQRPKFKLASGVYSSLLSFIITDSNFISPEPLVADFSDPGDLPFYESLLTAKADYLITGNLKHFPVHQNIITPAQFIERYLSLQ